MTRRDFMWVWAGAAASAATRVDEGRVLVVLQMAGGNDGLNTIVPFEDDSYGRARTTLRLGAGQVRKIAPSLGLHREMGGFERLLGEGRMTVLQGVGYPKMNRDHDRAMRNWQTAQVPEGIAQTGWLGRYADRASIAEQGNVPAIYVGRSPQPFTMRSREAVVPAIASAGDWSLKGKVVGGLEGCDGARKAAASVSGVLKGGGRAAAYPQSALAQSLGSVAQLMRAETPTRWAITRSCCANFRTPSRPFAGIWLRIDCSTGCSS
jgi:uncharacterized protein (DUF1501 family)